MNKFKLSFISDEVSPALDDAITFALENGIKNMELRSVEGTNIMNLSKEDVRKISHKLDDIGIRVSALSSPLFKWYTTRYSFVPNSNNVDTFGFNPIIGEKEKYKYIDSAIEICRILGTRYLRIFSLIKTPELYNCNSFLLEEKDIYNYLYKRASQYDIHILFEPEVSCNFDSISQLNLINNNKLLLDVGNLYQKGEDVTSNDLKDHVEKIEYIHIKDYSKKYKKFVTVGTGDIPYSSILSMIAKNTKKNLYLSLETHSQNNKLVDSQESINWIKNYLNLI